MTQVVLYVSMTILFLSNGLCASFLACYQNTWQWWWLRWSYYIGYKWYDMIWHYMICCDDHMTPIDRVCNSWPKRGLAQEYVCPCVSPYPPTFCTTGQQQSNMWITPWEHPMDLMNSMVSEVDCWYHSTAWASQHSAPSKWRTSVASSKTAWVSG